MASNGVRGDVPDPERDDVLSLDAVDVPEIEQYPPCVSVLLHGPPGTGKTTISAARVALLLRDYDYTIGDVAWATYRRSLAEDTLARLAQWGVIEPAQRADPARGATRHISTIHAIANRVVGGLDEPIDEWDKSAFSKKAGVRYKTDEPWEKSPGKELFRYFSWMANNCYDPGDPDDYTEYPHRGDLEQQFPGDPTEMWAAWEEYKADKEKIDFHEMLEAAHQQRAAPTNGVLVIDEYHDATPLMARVAECWMDAAEIVIVAGDPHQVVNQYEGASPVFFERLEETRGYPKILLDTSYRVGEAHWRGATSLLAKAHDPPTVTPTGDATLYEYRSPSFWYNREGGGWKTPAPTTDGAPAAIIDEYRGESPVTAGHGASTTMFLTRTKMQADAVGAALEDAGILYTSQRGLGGWNTNQGATRFTLFNALVKLKGYTPSLFDPDTRANHGLRKFAGETVPASGPPESVWLSSTEASTLLKHAHTDHLAQTRTETNTIRDNLNVEGEALSLTGLDEYVIPSFWGTYTEGAASERQLNKVGRSDRERTALARALAEHDTTGPINPSTIPISVMTIHASKGQEADDVVVYDGITSRIEREMAVNDDARRNEWRTWYVALTRAGERLHIMRDAFNWTSPIIPDNIQALARPAPAGGGTGDREDHQ